MEYKINFEKKHEPVILDMLKSYNSIGVIGIENSGTIEGYLCLKIDIPDNKKSISIISGLLRDIQFIQQSYHDGNSK